MPRFKKGLTIAIVTRKRPERLERCLRSVVKQKKKARFVLLIDNDSERSAYEVYKKFKEEIKGLRYECVKTQGIPQVRNRALECCETEFLAYVDDDCVLSENWIKSALNGISKYKEVAYVVGQSLLLNKKSIVARSMYHIYRCWFFVSVDVKSLRLSGRSLDTKNIVFRMKYFKKFRLFFDTLFNVNPVGGGEDVDMGLKLNELNLVGFYIPKMRLWHEEPSSVCQLVKKAYYRGISTFLLYDKWNLEKNIVNLKDLNIFKWFYNIRLWGKDYRKIGGGMWEKLRILILIKLFDRLHLQGFVDGRKKFSCKELN